MGKKDELKDTKKKEKNRNGQKRNSQETSGVETRGKRWMKVEEIVGGKRMKKNWEKEKDL